MRKTEGAEMPLLTEFMETVQKIGPQATALALANARNKSMTLKDDPTAQIIIDAVTEQIGMTLDQLQKKTDPSTKKTHGLIIISYCLGKLKYEKEYISNIICRGRLQIYRYNLKMEAATSGSLFKYKNTFELLIKNLIKKTVKKNKNGKRQKLPGTRGRSTE